MVIESPAPINESQNSNSLQNSNQNSLRASGPSGTAVEETPTPKKEKKREKKEKREKSRDKT